MGKVVELKLNGSLELGLQVSLAIAPEASTREVEMSGSLPPAPQLQATYNLIRGSITIRISIRLAVLMRKKLLTMVRFKRA